MEDKDKWLDDLRRRFDDYEEPVDMAHWERIRQSLPSRKTTIGLRNIIVRVVAVAACIGLVGGLYVSLKEDTANAPAGKVPMVDLKVGGGEASPVVASVDSVVPEKMGKKSDDSPRIAYASELSAEMPVSETAAPNVENVAPESDANPEKESEKQAEKRERRMSLYDPNAKLDDSDNKFEKKSSRGRSSSGKWGASFAVGNGFGSDNDSQGGFTPLAKSASLLGPQYSASPSDELYNDIMVNNIERDTRTDVEFDFPITFSAKARYQINDKFGVDAGVNFTKLGSSWKSGSDDYYYRVQQKAYFVGIPVDVNFTFFNSRYVSCYVLAGGSVEKCVGGSVKTTMNTGEPDAPSEKEGLGEHPWQFSVRAGAGVQFNISKSYGLFVEPQVAYYFDNAEKIELRKNNDPDFQLNVGMRFTY